MVRSKLLTYSQSAHSNETFITLVMFFFCEITKNYMMNQWYKRLKFENYPTKAIAIIIIPIFRANQAFRMRRRQGCQRRTHGTIYCNHHNIPQHFRIWIIVSCFWVIFLVILKTHFCFVAVHLSLRISFRFGL